MQSRIFNTVFENMLRVLLLLDVLGQPTNIDRITAIDFISIYGKKCRVLDKNLHGDNEFGFAEFANKREKITEAIKLSVKNNVVLVSQSQTGLEYSLNDRGKEMINGMKTSYGKAYMLGAKIVARRFADKSDEAILNYINEMATMPKEV